MKAIVFLCSALVLSSCDSFVSLSYYIENKTAKPVKVFVPHYRAGNAFGRGVDTTLEIGPHASRFVEATLPRISGLIGPAKRRIYREAPGPCGLKLIKADTAIMLGCTHKEWKLRRGVSVLKIKD